MAGGQSGGKLRLFAANRLIGEDGRNLRSFEVSAGLAPSGRVCQPALHAPGASIRRRKLTLDLDRQNQALHATLKDELRIITPYDRPTYVFVFFRWATSFRVAIRANISVGSLDRRE